MDLWTQDDEYECEFNFELPNQADHHSPSPPLWDQLDLMPEPIKPSQTYSDDDQSEISYSNGNLAQSNTQSKPKIRHRLKKDPKRVIKVWTPEEDATLTRLHQFFNGNWDLIVKHLPERIVSQCKQHWRRINTSQQLKRTTWTHEEDQLILKLVNPNTNNWSEVASKLTNRAGKQVRDRYRNHLRPGIVKDKPWTEDEDLNLIKLHHQHGPKWTIIENYMDGRTEIMIKNRYNKLTKEMQKQGGNEKDSIQLSIDVEEFIVQDQEPATNTKKDPNKQCFNFQFTSAVEISQTFSTQF